MFIRHSFAELRRLTIRVANRTSMFEAGADACVDRYRR
jgi:hypothetical protein